MNYWEHSPVLGAVRFLRVSWKSAILQKRTSIKSAREMFFPLQTLEMPASIATWVGSKATWAVFRLMTADAGCYRRQQEGPSSLWQLWLVWQGCCEHPREQKSKTIMSDSITGRWRRCRACAHRKIKNTFFFLFNVMYQVSSNWLMATERNNFCCH